MPSGEAKSYPYRFTTGDPREPREDLYITPEAQKRNDDFPLQFFFPKSASGIQKQTDLVIVLNGFGEVNRGVYERPQHGMCWELAAHGGMAAVLLPLPFHLKRYNKRDYTDPNWPKTLLDMIVRKKERFWYGYTQALADIGKLVRKVKNQSEEFFSKHFSENTRIHLLGYSLGGLGALSYQLEANTIGSIKCDSVCMLASGCSLRSLVPDEFREVSVEDWNKFVSYFVDDSFLKEVKVDQSSIAYRVFRIVVAGGRDDKLHELLTLESQDTLVILGSEDMTNRYQWVLPQRIETEGENGNHIPTVEQIPVFHTVIIPGMRHSLLDQVWKQNQSYVLGLIKHFAVSRPAIADPTESEAPELQSAETSSDVTNQEDSH